MSDSYLQVNINHLIEWGFANFAKAKAHEAGNFWFLMINSKLLKCPRVLMTKSCLFSVLSARSVVKCHLRTIKKILKINSEQKLRVLAPSRENLKTYGKLVELES
ncbi:hypothetical protein LNTAR_13072 [Lentisphaera araneosa HTCC2155]|uniref:Uncharacterized protein n=1 Tax=Lentisphaera araneosa HTCC2155 TaxID=313628 RepID=A6DRL3_9BACT|nr:hypothetical protein LNTAR_13072 [Lentisphaera araneosa HTCC2155]